MIWGQRIGLGLLLISIVFLLLGILMVVSSNTPPVGILAIMVVPAAIGLGLFTIPD